MTDRLHSLTVTLEKDLREDDAQVLIDAILQFRGVLDVRGEVTDIRAHMAFERAREELRKELVRLLRA